MADDGFSLPDDALVQVLLLLPTSSRRRFRLVCKRWRDLVDEHTPERQARTKTLAFFAESCGSRAVVFDGEDGSRRCHAWTYPCSYDLRYDLVGTCNGLLCLHERSAFGVNAGSLSAISVVNPITGESQLLPPAPTQRHWEQFKAFGMYYHPTTGEYKVVHIPCRQDQAVGAVWVFTLGGGTSWREVPVTTPGGASYHHSCAAVSVDGFTYWLDALADRVMALVLQDERVTCFDVPPALRRGLTPERKAGGG
ncbi:F-box protein At3g07870 [Setaria viridis]|uniref:F-box protein At3g07870 n=1 Tax=Setaria viridis TaxID=4556 RepID=UPI001493B888|nr:F-box protein At3g07870-like [Setaria viridis]